MQTVKRRAAAKVNLCLSVGAPEPAGTPKAGWHAIASWMQCIDLHDDVVVTRLDDGAASTAAVRWADDAPRKSDIDWPLEKDLAVRAHRAMEQHIGHVLPANVEVIKRVPVGGGLGGGSSDAAAALLALREVFELAVSDEELLKIALSLGSDVGYFLDAESKTPRPALVGGFGDVIQRVDPVASEVALIIPAYGCATPAVYKMFDEVLKARLSLEASERAIRKLTGPEKSTAPKSSLVEARWQRMCEEGKLDGDLLFNDLAIPAYRVEPRLGVLATNLSKVTRERVHVTGSGSCLFIPTTVGKIDKLMERIEKLLDAVKLEEFGAGAMVVNARLA